MENNLVTERNMLSTVSNDEITYCTLNFSNDTSDLWTRRKCLYWTDWFEVSNFQNAYIVLTNKSLLSLQTDFSEEYYQAFMANVELKHTFIGREETIYFYKGSEKLYKDILN